LSGSLDESIRLWQFGVPNPIGIYRADGMKVSGLAAASGKNFSAFKCND
jgi:hypothetical protein